MTRRAYWLAVAIALFAAFSDALCPAPAAAADLKVISAGAVRGLIAQIIDDYSRQTGQKFDFTIGTTGQLRNIIASGQHADLIIVSAPLMGELEQTGKLTPGSRAELAIVFISEAAAVKGVRLAGPLPPALQDYSAYAAAIPASSTDAAAARAFIAALTSAAMAERWRSNGFEPPK